MSLIKSIMMIITMTSPRHLHPALHAAHALLEVSQQTVDVPELPVGRGRGGGVAQVVADHQPLLEADERVLEVAEVPVAGAEAAVGAVLVPHGARLQRHGEELLVAADALLQLSEHRVAVAEVAEHARPLPHAPRLALALLQRLQLALEVADGLLEVAEVHPGDAHVAEGLGLAGRVLELPGALELLLEAAEGEGVVAEGHVHGAEVAVGAALAARVPDVLEDGELLQHELLVTVTRHAVCVTHCAECDVA